MKIFFENKLLWNSVHEADSFFKRFMGLMFKREIEPNAGLIISPCNRVHTFNMRFAIDVIYLSKNDNVIHIETMKPNKVGKIQKNAFKVLEVLAGTAKSMGLRNGDNLMIRKLN